MLSSRYDWFLEISSANWCQNCHSYTRCATAPLHMHDEQHYIVQKYHDTYMNIHTYADIRTYIHVAALGIGSEKVLCLAAPVRPFWCYERVQEIIYGIDVPLNTWLAMPLVVSSIILHSAFPPKRQEQDKQKKNWCNKQRKDTLIK